MSVLIYSDHKTVGVFMNFAFYRLVNYPTLNGFWMNLIKISFATLVFLAVSIMKLRREKYAAL